MIVSRFKKNPIFVPNKEQSWEAAAVFNACPIRHGAKIFLLYRALSLPHLHANVRIKLAISDIGIAESTNGISFKNRRRFIVPEFEWEKFGCEDPRVTKLNGKFYIFYTALSCWPPQKDCIRVGLAISKDLKKISEKHLITPFNAKAMALFPERINGKIWAILTINTDNPPAKICLASFGKEEELWNEKYWGKWYQEALNGRYVLPLQRRSEDHIEVGTPPVKTKYGWLIFYSYIRNYFSNPRLFGIEAFLLDLNDPFKIIAKTDFPILIPEEYYEKYGMVPNVIFPSGAIIKGEKILLYYGACDTTCCLAEIETKSFLECLLHKEKKIVRLERFEKNPIIQPNKDHPWESKATFNPGAIYLDNRVHLLYRAMSQDNVSVLGYAKIKDGIIVEKRSENPVYVPREPFEQKLKPGENSGVEDPRLVKIGDEIYMFYTAFDGQNPPKVALTKIKVKDFLDENWNWSKPVIISYPQIDNKDAAVFPEKISGKYFIIHRSGSDDIDISVHNNLNFSGSNWLEEYRWLKPRPGWWDSKKVGLASPPIKTKIGWLILYHGVSEEDGFYRVGAVLADLRNPLKIISRTTYPILEPEAPYEKEGIINNVVFPCAAIVINDKLFVYYGGADKVVAVATIELRKLLDALVSCQL